MHKRKEKSQIDKH